MGSLAKAGVTQLVECDLAKVDVAGSNPVSRSNPLQTLEKHGLYAINGGNLPPTDLKNTIP